MLTRAETYALAARCEQQFHGLISDLVQNDWSQGGRPTMKDFERVARALEENTEALRELLLCIEQAAQEAGPNDDAVIRPLSNSG